MGVDQAGVIGDLYRKRRFLCMTIGICIERHPCLHIALTKGVGHAQHLGRGVLSVVVDAVLFKVTAAAGFKVNVEHFPMPTLANGHQERLTLRGGGVRPVLALLQRLQLQPLRALHPHPCSPTPSLGTPACKSCRSSCARSGLS